MVQKHLKILLLLFIACLVGAGVFYFSNTGEKSGAETQTTQNLKLLNSHSRPEAGDEWAVSFETKGTADLTITPDDQPSIDDLDFASMKCAPSEALAKEGFGQEVIPEIQQGDVLFFPNWECSGVGILTHLVNVARAHVLKFQFGDKTAFAYNNPDSVTDTFTDESKIASKENIVVTGGQVKLALVNGSGCSSPNECGSGYCVDGVCCNTACTGSTCQRCDSYSVNGAGTCGYISTAVDPDNECGTTGCYTGNCKGDSYACGYYTSGNRNCGTCEECNTTGTCVNVATETDPYTQCGGTCCGYCNNGACAYRAGGATCSAPKVECPMPYECTEAGTCSNEGEGS